MTTSEKNRSQNCLTVFNLELYNIFSDVFVKSYRSITEQIFNTSKKNLMYHYLLMDTVKLLLKKYRLL